MTVNLTLLGKEMYQTLYYLKINVQFLTLAFKAKSFAAILPPNPYTNTPMYFQPTW